jgi:hypothetical protein
MLMWISLVQADPLQQQDMTIIFTVMSGLFSGVSIIVLLTAAWKLSALLAKIELKLEYLADLPQRLGVVEKSIGKLEADVNSLWQVQRTDKERT